MKIGIIQFAPILGHPDQTIEKIDRLLDQIDQVDLIVLPELANSGYHFNSREQAFQLAESVNQSRFITFLESKCKEKSTFIVSGFNEREGDRIYSSSVLTGPHGFIGIYRKIHLFWKEKDFFSPGNAGLPVFDIGWGKIGMLVCFDWIFPEVWRILAMKGADIICHPSNIILPYAQRVVPSHALINRVFIVLVNRTGEENGLTFTGRSIVVNPMGELLCEASEKNEQVILVDIDPGEARNKQITPGNNIMDDRLPEEYKELLG